MSTSPSPGWYKDPADLTTQRWWDGEGWLGDPIPADATPPAGPPRGAVIAPPPPPAPPVTPAPPFPPAPPLAPAPGRPLPATTVRPGTTVLPGQPGMPPGWPVSHRYPMIAPRPHGFMLAGVGSRFMSRFVDTLAVAVLGAVANIWFAREFWRNFQPVLNAALTNPSSNAWNTPNGQRALELASLMLLVLTAVWFAYEVPASANSGQTLGKRIFGIKVIRLEADERLGFGRSFRRWFRIAWPTPLWVACFGVPIVIQAIDCIYGAFDGPAHQTLHDKVANTVVVQVPRAGRPETARTPVDATPTGGQNADPR